MDHVIIGLAATQDGLLTRDQLAARGVTRSGLRHRLGDGGRWQPVTGRVLAVFTGTLTAAQQRRAALLHAGPDAQLAGPTALAMYGMRYGPSASRVHVLVPHEVQPTRTALVAVSRTTRLPVPRSVDGLPVSPPARAAVDAVRDERSLRAVRATLAEVVQRRLVTPELLAREVAEGPVRGSALARRAVRDLLAGPRSAPECEVRDLFGRSRVLPPAKFNHPLHDGSGRLVAVVDAYLEDVRLALEVDSVEHHLFRDQWEKSMVRHAAISALGVIALHVSPWRLRTESSRVLEEVEATYLALASSSR